jgi:hypothetical protein
MHFIISILSKHSPRATTFVVSCTVLRILSLPVFFFVEKANVQQYILAAKIWSYLITQIGHLYTRIIAADDDDHNYINNSIQFNSILYLFTC